jgi:hypothetical protein
MASNQLAESANLQLRSSEKVFVVVAVICALILPPLFIECFPLSTCSMFAHPYKERRFYTLRDAAGQKLNNDIYGLRTNVNWYLEYTYGVEYPPLVVPPSDFDPNIDKVASHIRSIARSRGVKLPLRLSMKVLGDVDGRTIGVKRIDEWTIEEIDVMKQQSEAAVMQ